MKTPPAARILSAAFFLFALAAIPARADLLAYEDFGDTGDLGGSPGGPNQTGFTGNWSAPSSMSLVSARLERPADVEASHPASGGRALFSNVNGPQPASRSLSTPIDMGQDGTYFISFAWGQTYWGRAGLKNAAAGNGAGRLKMGNTTDDKAFLFGDDGWESVNGQALSGHGSVFMVMKIVASATGTDEVWVKTYEAADAAGGAEPDTWDMHLTNTTDRIYDTFEIDYAWADEFSGIDEIRIGTTWRDVAATPPVTEALRLSVNFVPGTGDLEFSWNSQEGMLYDLLGSPGLDTAPADWPVFDDGATPASGLPADPSGTNTLRVPAPDASAYFFAVKESPAPPPLLDTVPTLDDLASDWMLAGTMRNHTALHNYAGAVQSRPNLSAFANLTLPPLAQGGESAVAKIDGSPVNATETKWSAYEIRRRGGNGALSLESAMRMPFEDRGVLESIEIENTSDQPRTFAFSLDLAGRIRKYAPQQWRRWGNTRPGDADFTPTVSGGHATISDNRSAAATSFAFPDAPDSLTRQGDQVRAEWNITLPAGGKTTVRFVAATGDDARETATRATAWAAAYDTTFADSQQLWEQRWQAAFTPGNSFWSGHLPTLVTRDAALHRVYYHGALVIPLMCRTTMPQSTRCFVTAGPVWANSLVYFWDVSLWANAWAMLEPTTMREQLLKWFNVDIHGCYAVDCMTGQSAGPWYAANDYSFFTCIEAYLAVTGDTAFLDADANGKTILQRLDDIAVFYESRPLKSGTHLADYGGSGNLLECSPSYIQGVAACNAANIPMLRKVADLHEAKGNATRAAELRAKAAALLPDVLGLYRSGQGVWNAMDKSGTLHEIRHCYDFIVTGQALENDLSAETKSEMLDFVENELLTKTWMRAMSWQDPAAPQSDRPDHGPMGAYDGWPGLTIDVFCRFGAYDKALSFYQAVEPVTRQGPFAQSHEFLGPDSHGYDPRVRTASRGGQDANEGCGAAFVDAMVRGLFGLRPEEPGADPVLHDPAIPRGFAGELRHLPFRGSQYTLTSDDQGVHAAKETAP